MKQLLILLVLIVAPAIYGQEWAKPFEDWANENYPADGPGATVLVAKDGEVLYRKAFGLANLELQVPMVPDNVLEIGSMTKQFTSVSILMLMEQGKLFLKDPITKFLPDYPTHENVITVHNLLNHTSGIKSYTAMRPFFEKARTDMSPKEIIDFFKDEPMDFQTNDAYRYNNSGYIILGYIIEEVSGMSYAEFVDKNIFQPLGMSHSYYGSKTKLIPNRALGYQPTREGGYQNAAYLSMTLPYAGGSLMSNVDDLLIWQQALHNNTLIKQSSKELAFTNGTLNNGDHIDYGYGFSVNEISDVPSIEHGGGIFGYECYATYVPSEDLYAVVLTNRNGNGPIDATVRLTAMAMGKPYPQADQGVSLSQGQLEKWVGSYTFPDGAVRHITMDQGKLFSQREGSRVFELVPLSENEFAFIDSLARYTFAEAEGTKQAEFKSRIKKSLGAISN